MKQLYREANPDPREVASRLTSALDAAARRDLSGPGVATCLTSLLQASRQVAQDGLAPLVGALPLPALMAASYAVRERAERLLGRSGDTSRFAELALNAVSNAVMEIGAGGSPEVLHIAAPQVEDALASYGRDRHLHRLTLTFLGHHLDGAYRYFIARDRDQFTDTPDVPAQARASQLADAVARHCRETAAGLEAAVHEEALFAGLRLADDAAVAQVERVLTDLTGEGLQRLAAAG